MEFKVNSLLKLLLLVTFFPFIHSQMAMTPAAENPVTSWYAINYLDAWNPPVQPQDVNFQTCLHIASQHYAWLAAQPNSVPGTYQTRTGPVRNSRLVSVTYYTGVGFFASTVPKGIMRNEILEALQLGTQGPTPTLAQVLNGEKFLHAEDGSHYMAEGHSRPGNRKLPTRRFPQGSMVCVWGHLGHEFNANGAPTVASHQVQSCGAAARRDPSCMDVANALGVATQ